MEQLLNRFGNVPEAKSVNGLTEAIQTAKGEWIFYWIIILEKIRYSNFRIQIPFMMETEEATFIKKLTPSMCVQGNINISRKWFRFIFHNRLFWIVFLDNFQWIISESVTKKQGSNAHETRQKCFQCFALVLSHPGPSKPKLCQLAIEGLQLVLRDPLLACDQQTGREADTMSCQMLACLEPVCSWSSQVQCQVLTVIVQLISSNDFKISQSNVFGAMQVNSNIWM